MRIKSWYEFRIQRDLYGLERHARLYEGYTANAIGEVDMHIGASKMN